MKERSNTETRRGLESNVRMDLKEIGLEIFNWIDLAYDRDK
jgi:hypothetical protein